MKTAWDWIWTIWTIAVFGTFAIFEGAALISRKPGTTLSEHVWRWILVRDRKHPVWSVVLRTTSFAFLAWLTIHLTFGILPSS